MLKFKVFGISIYLSYYFLFMITFLFLLDRTGLITCSLLAVMIHEFGHLLSMKILNINYSKIELFISSVRITGNIYTNNVKSLILAISGPLTNFLMIPFMLSNNRTLLYFGLCNLIIGAFNLLPAKNLDGGDALYHLLIITNCKKVYLILNIVTIISISLILFIGTFVFLSYRHNPTLIIVALYLIILSFIKV